MKIQLIGCGKIGEIILSSILKNGAQYNDVYVKTNTQETAEKIKNKYQVNIGEYIDSDLLILAVKPQQLENIDLQKYNNKNLIIISILAGTSIKTISSKNSNAIIRCMPNLPVSIGSGVIGYFSSDNIKIENKKIFENIFGNLGKLIEVDSEDKLDKITALSGSGPAYFYYFTEKLKEKAIKMGFSDEESSRIANNTFLGSALFFGESEKSVTELKEQVISKGGTTESALNAFEGNGFQEKFEEGIDSAYERAKELSN